MVLYFEQHPFLFFTLLVSLFIIILNIPFLYNQKKNYGSFFRFVPILRKLILIIFILIFSVTSIYSLIPRNNTTSDKIAIVIGNTRNTPSPEISQKISQKIESTLLQHRGSDEYDLLNSIKIISSIKNPVVIDLESIGVKFKEIGNNDSNASRSSKYNIKELQDKIVALQPSDNGANYFESILLARDNIEKGSTIIVIGSGLSDSGELNFSKTDILTNEQSRKDIIKKLRKVYTSEELKGYNVEFFGLGDSAPPQTPLSSKQKSTVRVLYSDLIKSLGGNVIMHTDTLKGEPVPTDYVVGTTDTGCGDIGLVYDDDSLKFYPDKPILIDESSAKNTLTNVKQIYDKYTDNIQKIMVDGYVAHYGGQPNLSQLRSDTIKNVLVNLGVPESKVLSSGKGYGPYQSDKQNRMVKITISRDGEQCNL